MDRFRCRISALLLAAALAIGLAACGNGNGPGNGNPTATHQPPSKPLKGPGAPGG
jgi:hypothetical protein